MLSFTANNTPALPYPILLQTSQISFNLRPIPRVATDVARAICLYNNIQVANLHTRLTVTGVLKYFSRETQLMETMRDLRLLPRYS
jgi:hypothetical protein